MNEPSRILLKSVGWRFLVAVFLFGILAEVQAQSVGADGFKRTLDLLAAGDFAGAVASAEIVVTETKRIDPQSKDHANALMLLADAKRLFKTDQEALQASKSALDAVLALREPQPKVVANLLLNLAILAEQLNQLPLAADYATREMHARESLPREEGPQLGYSLYRVARLSRLLQETSVAERFYLMAETELKRASGLGITKDTTANAEMHSILGSTRNAIRRFEEAKSDFQTAIAILNANEANLSANETRTNDVLRRIYAGLAFSYAELNEPDKALVYGRRALAVAAVLHSESDLLSAVQSEFVGDLLSESHDWREAEEAYRRAISIYQQRLEGQDTRTNLARQKLGQVLFELGQFDELHRMALKLAQSDDPTTLMNAATALRQQERSVEAEAVLRRAWDIQRQRDDRSALTAMIIHNLATTISDIPSRTRETRELYEESLELKIKLLGPSHRDVAFTLDNLASLSLRLGNLIDAEEKSTKALQIFEKTVGHRHPQYLLNIDVLGHIVMKRGDLPRAEALFMQGEKTAKETFGRLNSMTVRFARSIAEVKIARRKAAYMSGDEIRGGPLSLEAVECSRKAVRAVVHRLEGRQLEASDRRWITSVARPVIGAHLAELEYLLGVDRADTAKIGAEAFEVSQWANSSTSGQAIIKAHARQAGGNDKLSSLVRERQDLVDESAKIEQKLVEVLVVPSRANELESLKKSVEFTDRRALALDERIRREFPGYANLVSQKAISLHQLQRVLLKNEAHVSFFVGDDESYVFAVTNERFKWARITRSQQWVAQRIAHFRKSLDPADRSSQEAIKRTLSLQLANETFRILLGPVDDVIRDKSDLIIVPFGALTSLPFHLLVTNDVTRAGTASDLRSLASDFKQAAWLVRRHAISILPSVDSLVNIRSLGSSVIPKKPLIGFGDPVFSQDRSSSSAQGGHGAPGMVANERKLRGYASYWSGTEVDLAALSASLPRLPDTTDEVSSVARYFGAPASDVFLRERATESAVKSQALNEYRVVYFATHGLVAGDIGGLGEPSLALSLPREKTNLDDGLLTASEISQLKLNADWVVLSACNTIAGDKPGAEALSGLARSFFYAGARALLVSHWAVESSAAADILTSTFRTLVDNPDIGKAEALRRAMLGYLDGAGPRNADPIYWAPFSIVGEGRAVQVRR